jgi:acetate kinase
MSDIRVRTNSDNLIKVRLGADNANRVVSAVANLNMSLNDLDDVNTTAGIPDNSVLIYNSATEQWNPYPFIDGGTY